MFENKKKISVLLIALLCVTATMTNSMLLAGPHSLSSSEEMTAVGGNCYSLASGISVGLGIATLLGCGWCPLGVIAARAYAMYEC
jgi:hypothetical protein